MANAATMELNGDKALRNLFERLPKRLIKKGLRQAMNAAAEPIRRDAKARITGDQSGLLKKSIRKKIKTYPSGTVCATIGADKAVEGEYHGRKRVPFRYILIVDRGAKPHAQGAGQNPGFEGRRFMEDAYDAQAAAAGEIGQAKLKEALKREANALAKAG